MKYFGVYIYIYRYINVNYTLDIFLYLNLVFGSVYLSLGLYWKYFWTLASSWLMFNGSDTNNKQQTLFNSFQLSLELERKEFYVLYSELQFHQLAKSFYNLIILNVLLVSFVINLWKSFYSMWVIHDIFFSLNASVCMGCLLYTYDAADE